MSKTGQVVVEVTGEKLNAGNSFFMDKVKLWNRTAFKAEKKFSPNP